MKSLFNSRMTKLTSAILFTIPLANVLHADDDLDYFSMSLEELGNVSVVSAASGFEQKLGDAPATVTVITREQWQATGARMLEDVLMTVPGLHISKTQINMKHNLFILRGLSGSNGEQLKILIDGEALEYMQDSGLPEGFHLPLNLFSRIEVVKASGSAVYGADAFAGVVNLITVKESDNNSAGLRYGQFNTFEAHGFWSGEVNDYKVRVGLDYSRTDDDPGKIVNADLQSLFDSIFGTTASNAPGRIDERYEVLTALLNVESEQAEFNFWTYRNFDSGTGPGVANALDTSDALLRNRYNHYSLTFDLNDALDGLQLTTSYKDYSQNTYLHVFPAGSVIPIGADGNIDFVAPTAFPYFSDGVIGTPSNSGSIWSIKLTQKTEIAQSHQLRWEIGYEESKFRATESKNFGPTILNGTETMVDGTLTEVSNTPLVYLPYVKRDLRYISIVDHWKISDTLQLNAGIRFDDYSDFGSTTNPRVALIWNATERLNLKLFSGSAFRAPSITDLYAQNNPVGLGNRDIGTEDIDSYELGFNAEFLVNADLQVDLSLFRYDADNLIEFVFNPARQGQEAQNVGAQSGQGFELSVKWKPTEAVFVDFNYASIDAENGMGETIADIPEQQYYIGINWMITDDWNWNIQAKTVMNRQRPISDPRPAIEDYTLVNTRLAYANPANKWELALIGKNLFDENAYEPSNGSIPDDYPLAGSQWFIEYVYRFK